jgi:hypothetical protein
MHGNGFTAAGREKQDIQGPAFQTLSIFPKNIMEFSEFLKKFPPNPVFFIFWVYFVQKTPLNI